jgi:hypothetical protein
MSCFRQQQHDACLRLQHVPHVGNKGLGGLTSSWLLRAMPRVHSSRRSVAVEGQALLTWGSCGLLHPGCCCCC